VINFGWKIGAGLIKLDAAWQCWITEKRERNMLSIV